jgi:hypothetical protein
VSGDAIFSVAGLVNPTRDEAAIAMREGQYLVYRYASAGKLATYTNVTLYYGGYMEGLLSTTNLTTNGWITSGLQGWMTDGPMYVWESDPNTQTDGANYSGVKGRITNGDGTDIAPKPVAVLKDGRVVVDWSGGWMQNDTTFRVYNLVRDPGGRTGTIGANGESYEVKLGGPYGTFVGAIAGDYQYVPPPPQGTVVMLK